MRTELSASESTAGIEPPSSTLVLVDRGQAQGWRVGEGERLDQLFEAQCDWNKEYGRPGQLAVESAEMSLTYEQLDTHANQLARFLRLQGTGPGDRVALLFDSLPRSYLAMLAVLKIGATYVPLDPASPTGPLAYIIEDAQVTTVLSMTRVTERIEQADLLGATGATVVLVDAAETLIAEMDGRRLIDAERNVLEDNPLAYISYTSIAGHPEGVGIDHASLCNFVNVAAEVYGFGRRDRVYQGMPLTLDFAVEEIWVPWVCGSTLVPRAAGRALLGFELQTFLSEQRITALCCVQGQLESMDAELPDLRLLVMCGKDADPELIGRWLRPGRRFLNVYGPSEATVSATWTELNADKPITIGRPLPTYATVILDPKNPNRALPHGQLGEIGIAGIGLACGYLNHDDLTDDLFVTDFLGIPANPSGRIYRTGDLGRVNEDLEIEYHGQLDPDADRRGYRIEIGSVASHPPLEPSGPTLVDPGTQATMLAFATIMGGVTGTDEVGLDLHFFNDLGADSLSMAQFCARVRKDAALPPVSMKDIYRFPTVRALATALADTQSTPIERSLAEVMTGLIGAPVQVDSHFFDQLGADSLMMAQFCARVRKRVDLPTVSMKDIYAHSTIRALATALTEGSASRSGADSSPALSALVAAGRRLRDLWAPSDVTRPTAGRYYLCGAIQLAVILGSSLFLSIVMIRGIEWTTGAVGYWSRYVRSLVFTVGAFFAMCLIPVAGKWLLVGRWTHQQFPVWSLAYLRFWLAKLLVRVSPLALVAGSPLYNLYLRSLGAKIGAGTVILSRAAPGCPDMLTVGADTVIRKDTLLQCYRAHRGMIQIGPVTIGENVVIGERCVLEINTRIGDHGQLGHSSALHFGQSVPAGERWHGSPAQPTTTDYRLVEAMRCSAARRATYTLALLVLGMLIGPAVVAGVISIAERFPQIPALFKSRPGALLTTGFYLQAVVLATVLFVGAMLLGLLVVSTVPRMLSVFITPGRVYPLYGFHYFITQLIGGLSNSTAFTQLFGDSRYITGYLSGIGYRLRPLQQTGSNFGGIVKHDIPFLSRVGPGTVIADGLSFVNVDYSSTSFMASPVNIGQSNFLGNNIVYPAQGRTGANCLLATKVMIPIDGEVREGVGLLGSPCFQIPRTVDRDKILDTKSPEELRRQLRRKTVHNTVTIVLRLITRWLFAVFLTLLFVGAASRYRGWGIVAFNLATVAILPVGLLWFILVERSVRRLQTLMPAGCSIYDKAFWRHERYWKIPFSTFEQAFNGTPFKNLLWRALGVKIGKRVFDDGCSLVEKSFVTIGDYATLNAGTIVQCHSQEDDAFKSDTISLGAGCTLGVGAFVHYGVQIGQDAVLAPDSFLMKGEEVPTGAVWGGNPAGETPPSQTEQQPITALADTNQTWSEPPARSPAFIQTNTGGHPDGVE